MELVSNYAEPCINMLQEHMPKQATMLRNILLCVCVLNIVLCSGISNNDSIANAPTFLQNILNPSESLPEISFEDEQIVESSGDNSRTIISRKKKQKGFLPKVKHPRKPFNRSPAKTDLIIQLYRQGKSAHEIAKEITEKFPAKFKCGARNVSKYMKKQLGVTPEYKRNIPKGRYRISQDEKMKLEDLVKQGKSVGEILDIIEQEHRDGLWDRRVSKSTVIRIYRDHQK